MVATRRGAKKAPQDAPAASTTLNAPSKRGGRKKTATEDTVEPAAVAIEPLKTTAVKRKAVSEPEAADMPAAKKPTANSKATRTPKVDTKAEPAPAVAKRATRGRKATEPAVVEEPTVVEDAPKPATTRTRKAATTKTPSQVEEPAIAEAAVVEEAIAEEAPKPAPRTRRAPVKKAAAIKKAQVEEPLPVEPVKPVARGRKVAAPVASAPAPMAATRATRGRNITTLSEDPPLKAPARKPVKKVAAVVEAKPAPELVPDAFAQYPGYPTTPAHIKAPLTARQAMNELPHYPNTPSHILAPISAKDALSALPGYPKTPAHIRAPISAKDALSALPGYPQTPAHILAPVTTKVALAELPGYPKTPAHIKAPITAQEALAELPDYPKTPAHIAAPNTKEDAMALQTNSNTPAQTRAPSKSSELPTAQQSLLETAAENVCPASTNGKPATDDPSTPVQAMTPITEGPAELFDGCDIPTNIVWGVTNQEAFAEMPTYPTTPAHINAPVTTKQALAELPNYPQTPAHIVAPISTKEAFAQLPDYPTTPAMAIEAAIQEEITASVKKQTPSPLRFSSLDDVSFQFAETSECTDFDPMDVDIEAPATPVVELAPRLPLAPIQLIPSMAAPEPVSPKKSALRSPLKMDAKTPKKAVTWDDAEESELFLYDGPLQGMTFFVDVTSNGKDQNYLFGSLLEDLGAKTIKEWSDQSLSHVLFKDGSKLTLERVIASKGAIKCVNVGWVLDSEKNRKRMEEAPYLVDLSVAMPASPLPTTTMQPYTPARTPSKYALPPSSECKSIPTTPTSSEFDRSINLDDKENSEYGIYFAGLDEPKQARTVPSKKSSFLLNRSPIKTPSKPSFFLNTPVKPIAALKPFSTSKKLCHDSSFASLSLAPARKFRLF